MQQGTPPKPASRHQPGDAVPTAYHGEIAAAEGLGAPSTCSHPPSSYAAYSSDDDDHGDDDEDDDGCYC